MRVAVVGGAGRVGLPLALASARAGFATVIFDINFAAITKLRLGKIPFFEEGLESELHHAMKLGLIEFQTSLSSPDYFDIAFLTVATDLDSQGQPSKISESLALDVSRELLHGEGVLCIRSTAMPGTTVSIANAVKDLGLSTTVVSTPERILEGHAIAELRSIPQIIGTDYDAPRTLVSFFEALGNKILVCDSTEAELAKLIANAYRFVHFELANEFALICRRNGRDFSRIREIVTEDYPRASGLAKPGFVGGPCLPKDTVQLITSALGESPILEAAHRANLELPQEFVSRIENSVGTLSGKKVLLLGLGFKPGSDDTRGSVTYVIWDELIARGASVQVSDPFVPLAVEPRLINLDHGVETADFVVISTEHKEYQLMNFELPVFRFS